jgi:hypothetical protein
MDVAFQDKTAVEREHEPKIDAARLLAFDYETPQKFTHAALKQATRDATQMLLNTVFMLPTRLDDSSVFAMLPDSTYHVPRAKHVSLYRD